VQVFGGRTAVSRDNSLWKINVNDEYPSWTMLIQPGAPTAPQARQGFASTMFQNVLVYYGGQGNGGSPLSEVLMLDTCQTGGCGIGLDSTCNTLSNKRGECEACANETMCCRAVTKPMSAAPNLCEGLDVQLASCALDGSQFKSVMDYMLPALLGPDSPAYVPGASTINYGNTGDQCKAKVQGMCTDGNARTGKAKGNPILCSRAFMCAKFSPFMSMQVSGREVCGVAGATCPKREGQQPRNIMCCNYAKHLVRGSCTGLSDGEREGLAAVKFSECSNQPDCIAPPTFQFSDVAVSVTPLPRHMAASVGVRRSAMYILGGYSAKGDFLEDFWKIDTTVYPPQVMNMSSLRGGPAGGRRGAAMAAAGSIVILFGGEGPSLLSEDTFLFDTDRNKWTDITFFSQGDKPSARYLHAMAGMGATKAYLFGGETIIGKSLELFGEC
jgi:hypothetical protein